MKCKVRLSRVTELVVSAENEDALVEWLDNMTPESAYLEADGNVEEEYINEIVCNVRDDSDVDYEIKKSEW